MEIVVAGGACVVQCWVEENVDAGAHVVKIPAKIH
jgi:hypothetical protein